jgi:hypothetical protein
MSQIEILIILKELGGRCSSNAIIKRAKEKFPELSLWQYVGTRLSKMRKSGIVTRDNKTGEWYVLDYSPLENRNIVQ